MIKIFGFFKEIRVIFLKGRVYYRVFYFDVVGNYDYIEYIDILILGELIVLIIMWWNY